MEWMNTLIEPPKTITPDRYTWKKPINPSLKARDSTGMGIEQKQRIVLVSPYASFNFMFEHIVSQISKEGKTDVDIVSLAESPNQPYVDVPGRERKSESMPSCVIDFYRIGVKDGADTNMTRFTGYTEWIIETVKTMKDIRTRLLIPRSGCELSLRSGNYPVGSNFDPYSFRVSDLGELLRNDISNIVNGRDDGFYFFSEIVAKKTD